MKLTQEAKILLSIGVGTVAVIVGAVFFLSQEATNTQASLEDLSVLTQNAAHIIKVENAKVTVTEFADYQCPACALANPALTQIKQEYTGRVSFVYRHFPLPQHPNAMVAIYAAEAAGEQDKFWQMSEILYSKQTEWAEQSDPTPLFQTYAQSLSLDQSRFTEALKSKKYDPQIQKDLQDARKININSTPTIYINNQKFNQSATYQNLKAAVEKELNK